MQHVTLYNSTARRVSDKGTGKVSLTFLTYNYMHERTHTHVAGFLASSSLLDTHDYY